MKNFEFRGSLDGKIIATFPLCWVNEIIPCYGGTALVRYYDQLDEANRECNTKTTEIEVDYITIK